MGNEGCSNARPNREPKYLEMGEAIRGFGTVIGRLVELIDELQGQPIEERCEKEQPPELSSLAHVLNNGPKVLTEQRNILLDRVSQLHDILI
jgi:hypothetical protein